MSLLGFLDRIADVATFDKAIEPARQAVLAVLKPPAVKDFLHGSWLGHPLHPILVQVPVGSWISAGVLDLFPPLRPAATVLSGAGVTAAVPASLAGAADWSEQEAGVRRLGAIHALANTAALGLYVGSLGARGGGRGGVRRGEGAEWARPGAVLRRARDRHGFGRDRRAHVLRPVLGRLARGDGRPGADQRLDGPRSPRRPARRAARPADGEGQQRRRPTGGRAPGRAGRRLHRGLLAPVRTAVRGGRRAGARPGVP